jgi:copper transport protein
MRLAGRIAWLILAVFLALAAPATAHADLLDADPRPNTRVDQAPERLALEFSEPLQDTYTSVELVDANHTDHVDTFAIGEDRRQLEASLGDLEDGVYTVRWQALSSADGHTTAGTYLVAVNASLTDAADTDTASNPTTSTGIDPTPQTQTTGGPGEALLRAAAFLAASLALGVPLFTRMVRDVDVPEALTRTWHHLTVGTATAATLATLGLFATYANRLDVAWTTAAGTEPGANLLWRSLAFALATTAFALACTRSRQEAAALDATAGLGVLAGLLFTTLGGHAVADGVGSGLLVAVDLVHQLGVAAWVGGVGALLAASVHHTSDRSLAGLIRRFSPLAVASVALIVATGLVSSLDRLTAWSDLVDAVYGLALTLKLALLAPLVALGAYHRYRLAPRLDAASDPDASTSNSGLRRSAGIELGLMVVVLLAAGLMATASPPVPDAERAPYASFDDARRAQTLGPYTPEIADSKLETLIPDQAENVTLNLLVPERVDHLPTGDQAVWLLLSDANASTPITDASLEIRAWMPAHGHGVPEETDPAHVHEGIYEGQTQFTMPGAWQLNVTATLASGDELAYRVPVFVDQPADPLVQRDAVHTFTDDEVTVDTYLAPKPVQVGVQNLTVQVTPETEHPDNADVVLNLEGPSTGTEGRTVSLDRWRTDAWTREDALFTEPGEWTVLVAVQGKGTYVADEFTVSVAGR